MEIVCMAEQIGVIENILRNGKRMWGGGWENCKDGGKTYNKGKTEMLDKTILPPYRLGNDVSGPSGTTFLYEARSSSKPYNRAHSW